jgi:iduronate 2-sulfatase
MKLPPGVKHDWDDIPKAGISKNSVGSGLNAELDKQKVLEAYYASVAFMDAQVGKIINAVNRLGLRDNTIIVFTADHGYHLGEHDFWQKMSLHEESTRIPLIIHVPGKQPSETTALSQQIDIYPTLAELCGLPVPKHVQGKSLATVLDDPQHVVHEAVYCLRGRNDHLLRTDGWALIRYGKGDMEMYDMQADSLQFTNLATDPRHKKTLTGLLDKLNTKLNAMN